MYPVELFNLGPFLISMRD